MTKEEMRIAIALDQGWKWYRRLATGPWAKKPHRSLYNPGLVPEYTATLTEADMTERACNEVFVWREGMVPDYTEDLNAIIPLLPTRTYIEKYEGLWKIYIHGMIQVICRGKDLAQTACEFYLRVNGLWK